MVAWDLRDAYLHVPIAKSSSEISPACSQPGEVCVASSIQSFTLQAVIFPQGIDQSDGGSIGTAETEGNLYCALSGRPVALRRLQESGVTKPTGDLGQLLNLEKSNLILEQQVCFLGVYYKRYTSEDFSPTGKGREGPVFRRPDSDQPLSDSSSSYGSARAAYCIHTSRSVGQTAFSSSPDGHFTEVVIPRIIEKANQDCLEREKGPLVAKPD